MATLAGMFYLFDDVVSNSAKAESKCIIGEYVEEVTG
jgi:hypothetical protein